MSINTDVYGKRATWDFTANTGETGDADTSTYILHESLFSYANTPPGQPIDKSLACSALGTESCWSHLKFYDTSNLGDIASGGGGFATPDIIENRLLTNWCFSSSLGTFSGSTPTQQFAVIVDGNSIPSGTQTNPENSRYSPSPVVSTYNLRYNPSDIKPITQFCHKNIIACLYVRAFDSPFNDYITADLNTYINSYSSSYPRIRSVYVKLFTDYGQIQRGTIQGLDYLNVSLLDNIQLPVTKPYMYGLVTEDDSNGVKIKIMGSICNAGGYFDTKGSTDSSIKTYIGLCAPDTWNVRVDGGGGGEPTKSYGPMYRDYDETFKDECFTQIACFGLLFTDRESVALNGLITDENMHCGILDENLIGHGKWTSGAENTDNVQLQWDNSNDSTYDGNNPPSIDPNNYNGKMRTHDLLTLGTATDRYNIDAVNMQLALLPKLWDIMALADPDENLTDYSLKTFLVNNPIDAIVSLQWLPVKDMGTKTAVNVHLGTYDTGVSAVTAKTYIRYDCGNYEIYPRFGNSWIDRETQITLYLPFCGTISLDAETYMGRTVNVEYLIDLTTGTCTAVVSFIGDGGERVITDTASGVCAIDLPVTGIQQQTLNSQLFNASESVKQLKVNNAFKGFKSIIGAVSSLNGNPTGSINSILNATQDIYNIFQGEKIADYNLEHTMLPMKMIGTSGGVTGAMCELYPTIIFSRPNVVYNKDAFAHSNGFACCISGSLSGFSGYTEVTNVDLSGFSATATEKSMIQSALAGGVIL